MHVYVCVCACTAGTSARINTVRPAVSIQTARNSKGLELQADSPSDGRPHGSRGWGAMFLSSMCRRSPHAAHHAGTRFGRLRIVLTMCRVVHLGCHRHRYLVEPRVVLVLDFDFDFGLDFHRWHRPSRTAGGGFAIMMTLPRIVNSRGSPRPLSGHSVTPFFYSTIRLMADTQRC